MNKEILPGKVTVNLRARALSQLCVSSVCIHISRHGRYDRFITAWIWASSQLEFISPLAHLLTVCTYNGLLASLSLSFFIFKMEKIVVKVFLAGIL
uniref:Uncharacterized protein n=1 Tax=Macaca fascicularis TaxID=9541 RepID=Q9GMI0_MACFA|nr:hypothetical protein [Macaca fascicularis]